MRRFHVRRGDLVVVIAGTQRGRRGKIIRLSPDKQRVIVEGVKMIKKHMRKSRDHPEGKILQREGSIHLSNVMKAEKYDARAARRAGAPAPA
jgi:large subunit ribosomal protein L24